MNVGLRTTEVYVQACPYRLAKSEHVISVFSRTIKFYLISGPSMHACIGVDVVIILTNFNCSVIIPCYSECETHTCIDSELKRRPPCSFYYHTEHVMDIQQGARGRVLFL